MSQSYQEFLQAKICIDPGHGWECDPSEVHPLAKPHQRDMICWGVRKGRAAFFTAFGLGKTLIQLETVRITLLKSGGKRGLIILPLGVRQEFKRDAQMLGQEVTFIRSEEEATEPGIYLTNYETVRNGKLDPRNFDCVSLDEASCLRGFGGTKTFREFMRLFEGSQIPRFVATATPSPNEFIELLAYAAFLDVMDVGQGKTRFFKRNSEKADKLTIHPHKEREFWLWVASWAIFVQKPSDLGHSDEGYDMPALDVRWHCLPSDHTDAGTGPNGQGKLLKDAAYGVQEACKEKRDSLPARIEKMMEIRAEDPGAHRLIWHDLEDERRAIEKAIPGIASVHGNQNVQSLDKREQIIIDFSNGDIAELAAKPVIAGSGCNFQRHCNHAIFMGIGYKFNDFLQAIHRIQRFLQTKTVRIDLIYTEAESEIRVQLERKWQQHEELVANMTNIIQEYGLSTAAMSTALGRSIGVEREEASGRDWTLVRNDSVVELESMDENSVDLIVTSIPFSTQYEYSPSYNDFGHTDSNEHFWQQMGFLIPGLLKVLKPGRVAAIHVKDRVVPGGLTGLGFQTVYPFSDDCIREFQRHGFAFLARKTVVTDVVRENAQTYRLGWTEQCKDGSRMGCGMPEYVLLFRKPPTDSSNGYADEPVVKGKAEYSRARWQFDAHGFTRSSGNRLLTPADFEGISGRENAHQLAYRLFRQHSLENVYDFENDVALAESLDAQEMLPPGFMLLQPQSWHDDVWTDVTRMLTLNAAQNAKGKEMHLCPMQFDIADRLINQFTMPGETVFDPFAGLGTVPLRAFKLDRIGRGCELSAAYWQDSVYWLKHAETEASMPTLFDLMELEGEVALAQEEPA